MKGEFDEEDEQIGTDKGVAEEETPPSTSNRGRGGRGGRGRGRGAAAKAADGRSENGRHATRDYNGWEEYLFEEEDADDPDIMRKAKNRMRKDQLSKEHKSKRGKKSLWLVYVCVVFHVAVCALALIAFLFTMCNVVAGIALAKKSRLT